MVARQLEVTLAGVLALGGVLDEAPALVQVVPVHLAVTLRVLGGLAGEAQLAGHGDVLAGVAVGAWLVVQRPDQCGQLLALVGAGLGQCLEGLEGEVAGAHGGYGGDAVVHQGDGVEDPLDDPQLVDRLQVDAGRAPPVALR